MPTYNFTSDLRISMLPSRIETAAKEIISHQLSSDKSLSNNRATLAFYFNLIENTNTIKLAANGAITEIVRNFVTKFQYPNTYTADLFFANINDNTFIAPLREIIKLLAYQVINRKIDNPFLTFDEIRYFIFSKPENWKDASPTFYDSILDTILTNRSNGVDYSEEIERSLDWKQYERQSRELISIIPYACDAFKVGGGKISLSMPEPLSESFSDVLHFLASTLKYKTLWIPSDKEYNSTTKQSYIDYLDINGDVEYCRQSLPEPDFIYNKYSSQPLQQIFYGAPGTGKSFAIDNMADDDRTVRTTFHPDSDYASFVGAYKPTMEDVPINSIYGESVQFATGKNGHPGTERKIVYKYVPQAFLKAYVEAWKDLDNPHYLVIEEINRGNCAQIFGDLFQLLDRNAMGCSSYAIHADDDIRQFLASDEKGFGKLSEEQTEAIRSFVLIKDNGSQKQIGEQIVNGEQLLLPPNLYIWATMNTSDQSLFPIDSAFKRRWNWKFVPINYEQKDWLLHIGDSYYRWGDFLKQINPIIFSLTESSDKQMGYFFAKPDEKIGQNVNENNTISEDIFLNKVLFYIWTDILKDFDAGKEPFINPESGRAYEFSDFFKTDKNRVVEFITKSQFGLEEVDVDDEPSNAEEEERQSKRSKYNSLTVSFLDGSVIKEETIVATYLKAIEKIGIEKAAEVAATLKYKRRGHPLITKEPVQELLDNNYTYATIGGYSVLKGIKTKSLVLLLRQINDVCNLGLNITLE